MKKFLLAMTSAIALCGIAAAQKPEKPKTTGSSQNITGTAEAQKRKAKDDQAGPVISPVSDPNYRAIDGSGNNPLDPSIGAALTQLDRLAPSDYDDGISTLAGSHRPSARAVSNIVSDQGNLSVPNEFGKSDFLWQWGQFLDHDLGLSDGAAAFGVANIPVPADDPDFAPAPYIPFARAIFDPATGEAATPASPREQLNQITSWIDASNVYGSEIERAEALRTHHGRMAMDNKYLLPRNTAGFENANGPGLVPPEELFLAGDVRANEQVGLAVMHTLFVREHNRLLRDVRKTFPELDDDGIYHVTRKLVGAQMQIITYKEFLPALLGPFAPDTVSTYDPTLSGAVLNEFSVAAYRFGHSAINESILRLQKNGKPVSDGPLAIRDAFFNAPLVLKKRDDIDPILRGLAAQKHQKIDALIVDDLRNFLFGAPGAGGLDLASLNIQRGRDHGVPGYNAMRTQLGLPAIATFADFPAPLEVQIALSDAYASPDDIDLWVGGLAESAAGGSQLGPLFTEILVRQFTRLRDGDRFWYTRHLSPEELALINGITLAKIIRMNTKIGDELSDDVFSVSD